MNRELYATDLTDAEGQALEPCVPALTGVGRSRRQALRDMLHAMFSR
jgi:transposase